MQTFTPYADFEQALRTLDLKRLGKQRVEVIQIVRALTVPGYAWSSHPAVLMWKGYEEPLGRYGLIERELRKEENAQRRAQRTAEKLVRELERARKKRSEAARRGWKTRSAKARREAA